MSTLTLLVEDLQRKKLAAVTRSRAAATPGPGSRHVPAAVKRKSGLGMQGGAPSSDQGAAAAKSDSSSFITSSRSRRVARLMRRIFS
jgi:hypothetical protein